MHTVVLYPYNISIEVRPGTLLLDAIVEAGIPINAVCGGKGACGKCRIYVRDSIPEDELSSLLSGHLDDIEFVLACQTSTDRPVEVYIPPGSVTERMKVLTQCQELEIECPDPLFRKSHFLLPAPTLDDSISDVERIRRELAKEGISNVVFPLDRIKYLGKELREAEWDVTVSLSRRPPGFELMGIESGDTSGEMLGLAVDIGTTTIAAELLDLKKCEIVARAADYNKQMIHGEDVLTRIDYSSDPGRLGTMQELAVGTVNTLIRRMGHLPEKISSVVVAGNTVMMHLFYGVHPRFIKLEPYVPVACAMPVHYAGEVGLDVNPHALLHSLPSRAGYVGGDITSDILATRMYEREKVSIMIDVGTNGEVVVGNREWLVGCACSAGPAFEGGEVESGMRATTGAIEKLDIDDNGDVEYHTIENTAPIGICGSGLIDLLAEMFTHNIIDRKGNLQSESSSNRIRTGENGPEYVVVPGEETGDRRDITITEVDIQSILRSKAAVYAATALLLRTVGMDFTDMDRIFIAGGFGNYLDIRKAILLGLMPDISVDRFSFIGNGSLSGARMVLLSDRMREIAHDVYRKLTYVELSVNRDFFDEFSSAMFIPHTDLERFPSVKKLVSVMRAK